MQDRNSRRGNKGSSLKRAKKRNKANSCKNKNRKKNNCSEKEIKKEENTEENIPKKSKQEIAREKIFEAFKTHLSFLNDKGFVSTKKDIYICPLDLKEHKSLNEIDPLTLEDAPPKSLGGKAHVLTCLSCNGDRGRDIDATLAKAIKDIRAINEAFNRMNAGQPIGNLSLPRTDHDITLEVNGKITDGKLRIKKDGVIEIVLSEKHPTGTVMNFIGSKISKEAQYSLLKAAYILLFEKRGYTLMLDECYDIVREQINNPKNNIYPDNFTIIFRPDDIYMIEDNKKKEIDQGVYFITNEGLEAIFVVFDLKATNWKRKIGITLPLPINRIEDVIPKIQQKFSQKEGLILYPKEQDRDNTINNLMNEDNLKAMYGWIEERKERANKRDLV